MKIDQESLFLLNELNIQFICTCNRKKNFEEYDEESKSIVYYLLKDFDTLAQGIIFKFLFYLKIIVIYLLEKIKDFS